MSDGADAKREASTLGIGRGPAGEPNFVEGRPGAPKRVSVPDEWRERLTATTIYSFSVVDKISTRGKRERRYMICSSLFVAIFDDKRNVKRVYPYDELTDLTKDSSKNELLIRATNPPGGAQNATDEPDVILAFTDKPENEPKTMNEVIEVITKMCKAIPPHYDVKCKEASEVRPGASLSMLADFAGQKVDVLEKKKRIMRNIKMQEQRAAQKRLEEQRQAQLAEQQRQAQLMAERDEQLRLQEEELMQQEQELGDDDSDDMGEGANFHSGALRGAPIAGQIDRQSQDRSSRTSRPYHVGGELGAHPRWVPDSWRDNKHMMRPVPTDGAEPDDWRLTGDGGPWMNTRTGQMSAAPPEELYDNRRRFQPTTVEAHVFPKGAGSPAGPGSPRNGGRRVVPWVPATTMASPGGYRGSPAQPPTYGQRSNAPSGSQRSGGGRGRTSGYV